MDGDDADISIAMHEDNSRLCTDPFSGRVEHSVDCVGVSACVRGINVERNNNLLPRYLARWFRLTLSGSSS